MGQANLSKIIFKVILGIFFLSLITNLAWLNAKTLRKNSADISQSKQSQETLVSQEGDKELKIIEVCGPECLRVIESTASALTARIEEVEKKVGQQKASPTQAPSGSSSGPKVTYIPVGITGASTSRTDWETTALAVNLSGDDFPGYKHMMLEGFLKVKDGNGKAFARLLNSNDGTAILGSEIETTNWDLTLVESGQFRIASSKKLYKLQLKSLTGYESSTGLVRIKVVF